MAPFAPCPESISAVVSAVDHHFALLLSSPATRRALQLHCTAKLAIPSASIFEFSQHSILSNLYWGIETIESAVNAGCTYDRNALLSNSEKMLQIPAMLDEVADTAGIDNKFIVCCSYFHLAIIRKLWRDEWQMAMHFFQAVLVSPGYIRAEFTPELYWSLFDTIVADGGGEEAVRRQARRYKDCLMFYQVISYGESRSNQFKSFSRNTFVESHEQAPTLATLKGVTKGNQLDLDFERESKRTMATYESTKFEDKRAKSLCSDKNVERVNNDNFDQRRLQEMLEDSQSESSVSIHSDCTEAGDSEVRKNLESPGNGSLVNADLSASDTVDRNFLRKSPVLMYTRTCGPKGSVSGIPAEDNESIGCRSSSSRIDRSFSTCDSNVLNSNSYHDSQNDTEKTRRTSPWLEAKCFSNFSSKFRRKCSFSELINHGVFTRSKKSYAISEKCWSEEDEKARHTQLLDGFEKVISALCTSEDSRNFEEVEWEMSTMWEMLHNKPQLRYNPAKQDILKQLLKILSNSKRERDLRVSVSTLLCLIAVDKTIIDDIKREDLPLCNLATALKRNVHEAAILIYLLNPSPSEIKSLELLPSLVEIACDSNKKKQGMGSLTPTSASIAMIEILVTAFDYVTNNMHLAAISSPHVLSKLVNAAMTNNVGEGVALSIILMRCLRLNGNSRKFLSQVTPIDPFIHLLGSDKMSAKSAALEYFHELLCMPRSEAIRLLHQIRQAGRDGIMRILLAFVKQVKNESQLLAANLLFQLGMLEGTKCRSEFMEEAMGALLEAIAVGENPSTQSLSAFILSNMGGTFSWTGESYTAAWLVKKAGLTASDHRNMVRDIDWLDPCLQDSEMCAWSRMAVRMVVKFGRSIFSALAKGIRSQRHTVHRDCLVTTAWLGAELAVIGSGSLRYSACEILLDEVAAFLHPGTQLDERVLACLSVYNYTSGKGKLKLLNFSEGLRESLRRLSGVTWMAEELLNVTDYVLPTKSRVSCVHTQTLEIVNFANGSAMALIFYKGHLYTGYSDGSIKVWDIKEKRPVLLWEAKMHKRSVTCFAVYEEADSLLSGSADKTVRVWKNAQKKFECVEVIQVKEAVQKLGACNEKILIVTQSRGLKVCLPSRSIQTVCKNNHVTSLAVFGGKIYLGCTDSSMQEIDINDDNPIEIRPPSTSWKIQKKPINSICVYKGWIYCAGASVHGSSAKDWRRRKQPQISVNMLSGNSVQAMSVSEDFFYLNRSLCPNTVQIFMRQKQQSVGRLSAGSKVTSLLTANDMILCGTEAGMVKGWITL